VLERFPPTRLGPNDLNLTSLYKPPSAAPDFVFNPRRMSQEEAEAFCQAQGGHLAAYISKMEQYLVEQTLVNKVGRGARLAGWPCCCCSLWWKRSGGSAEYAIRAAKNHPADAVRGPTGGSMACGLHLC
jgi:hypothetical protein